MKILKVNIFKLSKFLIMLLCFSFLLSANACARLKEKHGTIYAFSTTIDITFYGTSTLVEEMYDDVCGIFYDYSKLADNFQEYDGINNIYTINHASDFVEIDSRLKSLLVYSNDLKIQTDGYFNPLIGNVTSLYKQMLALQTPTVSDIPSVEVVNSELEIMNNSSIVFEGTKVKIEGDATIDLGAIAKGYALNQAKEYFANNNSYYYLIDAGSSSIALGEKFDNEYYNVGLKYYENIKLQIKNKSIGTSSIKEQNVIVNGKTYHHIINPITGKCESNYDTIYLIGENAALLDGFVTAFMSMELEDIKRIVESKDFEILIFKNNNIIYRSSEGDIYE